MPQALESPDFPHRALRAHPHWIAKMGSSNGNPHLPHLSSARLHLYSSTPPLPHARVPEYQPPPYFPPSYQQLTYPQSADLYLHLGEVYAAAIKPLHQPPPTGSQAQAWPSCQIQEEADLPLHHRHLAGLLPTSPGWTVVL